MSEKIECAPRVADVMNDCPVGSKVRWLVSAHPIIPQHIPAHETTYEKIGPRRWSSRFGEASTKTLILVAKNYYGDGRTIQATIEAQQ